VVAEAALAGLHGRERKNEREKEPRERDERGCHGIQ
jgi:hypothetical protein